MNETLPKSERLSGQTAVSALFERGKGFSSGCLRCKVLPRQADGASALPAPEGSATASRIVVSVPKRLFKRAVKRNLLKRRIREAYRHQKALLSAPVDILFVYTAAEVLPYDVIFADMTALLTEVSQKFGAQVIDS